MECFDFSESEESAEMTELDHALMTFRDIKFLMILIINCACGLLSSLFLSIHVLSKLTARCRDSNVPFEIRNFISFDIPSFIFRILLGLLNLRNSLRAFLIVCEAEVLKFMIPNIFENLENIDSESFYTESLKLILEFWEFFSDSKKIFFSSRII